MKQTNGVAGVKLNPNSSAPPKQLTFVHSIPNNTAYVLYAQPDLHHSHYEGVSGNPMAVVGIVPAGANFSAFRPIQQQNPVQPALAPNQLYAVQTSHASNYALPPAISVQNKFILASNAPLQPRISPQPVLVATTPNESWLRPQHPPITSRSFPIGLSKLPASSLSASLRPPPAERQSIPPSYDATLVALQSGQAVVRSARSTLRNRRISPSSSSSNNGPRTRNDESSGPVALASATLPSAFANSSQAASLGISNQNGQHTKGTSGAHANSGVPVRPRSDSVGANRAHRGPQEEEARKEKLAEVAQQLADLKHGLRDLRRAHVRMKEEADESLLAFRRTMRALLVELPAASRTPLRRERLAIDQELGDIRRDQTTTLSTLGEVEDAVGEVRQSLIASHEARVQMPLSAVEIEAYILQLGRVVSALSTAEQRFFSQDKSASESSPSTPSGEQQQQRSREQELNGGQQERSLATRCKDLWVSEMEIIVEEERFLKAQPETLGNALLRCKQIGRVLLTLKKIAQVQQSQAQLSAARSAVAGALQLETNPTPTHADKQLVLDNIHALLPNSEQRLHAINESEERNRRRKKFLAEYERLQMEKLLGAQRRNFRPERDRGANGVPAGDARARSAARAASRADDRTTGRAHLATDRADNPHNTNDNTNPQEGTATIMQSFDEDAESLRKLDSLFNELDTMLEDLDKLSNRPRNDPNSTNDSNSRDQNGSGSDESDYDNFNSLGSPTARQANESSSAHTSAGLAGHTLPEEQTSDSSVQSETMEGVESVANAGDPESDVPVAGKQNSVNGKRVKTLKGVKKSIWNPFRLIRFGSAQTINKSQSASNRSEAGGEEVSSSSNSSSAETVVLATSVSLQPVAPNKAAARSAAQPKSTVPQATSTGVSRKSQSLSTMGRRPSDSSFSRGDRSLSFIDPESQ